MKLFCVIELREGRLVYVLLTLSQEGRNLKSSSLHLSVLSSHAVGSLPFNALAQNGLPKHKIRENKQPSVVVWLSDCTLFD